MNSQEKNALISARILGLVQGGMSVRAAFDAVLGDGSYVAMADELYDSLRANGKEKGR